MTKDQIYLLRKTFDHVERHTHAAALVFYRRLFELDPSLRPLFHTDIETQARKLIDMLGQALSLLDRPGALSTELEDLGARHLPYGVRDEHYGTVGQAMLDMLAEVLGIDWTPAVRQAWADFYSLMSEAMLHGAARAKFSAGHPDEMSSRPASTQN